MDLRVQEITETMKTGFRPPHRLPRLSLFAFSLIELLVVITIIAVLASLLMPAFSKARQHATDLQCRNQIRQLTLAWCVYPDDNGGRLVPNRLHSENSWVGGVMGFDSTNPDSTNTHKLLDLPWSKLGPYAHAAQIFKCPSDLSHVNYGGTPNHRVRSCSMNSTVGFQPDAGPLKHSQGWKSYRRSSDITSPVPSQLWVLTEEHPDSVADCVFTVDLEDRGPKARFISVPAHYHNSGANFSFADGHVERHRWRDARTLLPDKYSGYLAAKADAGYYTALPNSPDVAWVQEHSSSKNY
jgi:prepilin-type processing-associated H-X9-DG protein/prepilin-type N-terminal cleavage/methylation domain-containing protein